MEKEDHELYITYMVCLLLLNNDDTYVIGELILKSPLDFVSGNPQRGQPYLTP